MQTDSYVIATIAQACGQIIDAVRMSLVSRAFFQAIYDSIGTHTYEFLLANQVVKNNNRSFVEYITATKNSKYEKIIVHICKMAAEQRNLDILKIVHNAGWEIKSGVLFSACLGADIDCIRFLCEIGVPVRFGSVRALAEGEDDERTKECLRYIIERFHPTDKEEARYVSLISIIN